MLQFIQSNVVNLLAFFVAVDALLTIYMLASGGVREANPLLLPLFERFGSTPTLLVTHGAFIALLYLWPLAPVVYYVLLAVYAGTAAWNLVQLVRRNRQAP